MNPIIGPACHALEVQESFNDIFVIELYFIFFRIQMVKMPKMEKMVSQLLERRRKRKRRSQLELNQEMDKVD